MSELLPPWPELPTGAPHQIAALVKLVGYERRLRLAWEARARLMEKALREVSHHADDAYGFMVDVEKALSAVGDLPALDKERG